MRTSKAYFEKFKAEFLRWQQLLGLTQYRIVFSHEKLKNDCAKIIIGQMDKLAKVILSTELPGTEKEDEGPESHAKHEAIHLLESRLAWLGACRYIEESDLNEECEAVVVRLEKVLK